jgi:hypothetical protein
MNKKEGPQGPYIKNKKQTKKSKKPPKHFLLFIVIKNDNSNKNY